jgi:hypothetical protein
MKKRFESLRALNDMETAATEDMYKTLGGDSTSPLNTTKEITPPNLLRKKSSEARGGWSNLRRVVHTEKLTDVVSRLSLKGVHESAPSLDAVEGDKPSEVSVTVDGDEVARTEAETLLTYWKGVQAALPAAEPFAYNTAFPLDNEEIRPGEATDGASEYLKEFESSAGQALVEILHVPEDLIQQRRDEMEALYAHEQRKAAEARMQEEAALIWREHRARVRVQDLETAMWSKLHAEKQKLADATAEREQKLSWQFRKAREDLETGLTSQLGEIREKFGVLTADKAARMYDVVSSQKPHPIEMRVHLLRAVKNKLPKGAYVLMLTQYDRLGGMPLTWSKIGSFGMNIHCPGVTRPIKHYGRYFDRAMRVEDSVFALCPPRRDLKPSYALVIELFFLANRRNPKDDAIVAWTALPMCIENLGIVEGKYKVRSVCSI